jgi:hypothetical protein
MPDLSHPFGVQIFLVTYSGGLRCAPTSGYSLATLQVAEQKWLFNSFDKPDFIR